MEAIPCKFLTKIGVYLRGIFRTLWNIEDKVFCEERLLNTPLIQITTFWQKLVHNLKTMTNNVSLSKSSSNMKYSEPFCLLLTTALSVFRSGKIRRYDMTSQITVFTSMSDFFDVNVFFCYGQSLLRILEWRPILFCIYI